MPLDKDFIVVKELVVILFCYRDSDIMTITQEVCVYVNCKCQKLMEAMLKTTRHIHLQKSEKRLYLFVYSAMIH